MLLQNKQNSRLRHYHKTKYGIDSAAVIVQLIYFVVIVVLATTATAATSPIETNENLNRRIWPPMKHYDIWSANTVQIVDTNVGAVENVDLEFISQQFKENINITTNNHTFKTTKRQRQERVIHLFPVPVDGECLAEDGRRTGICHNAYECRLKGGLAQGECAMGFGVCCIFMVNCTSETIINNNLTYLVSPNFPTFMPHNLSACSLKVKLINDDVSQLRIDFLHFSLGQPNRRTGVCDGDVFNISGGPAGVFSLCGQNSGQHVYYDVGIRALPRQTLFGSLRPLTLADIYANSSNNTRNAETMIEISMNFTQRFLPQRLWDIRITQIPFTQRAPPGCLQYHSGNEGVVQTFNFADNGRHLANQNYRICMRQETGMCSIIYQPCDEQSFRIGPNHYNVSPTMTPTSMPKNSTTIASIMFPDMPAMPAMMNMQAMSNLMGTMGGMVSNIASTMSNILSMPTTTTSNMLVQNSAPTTSSMMGNTMVMMASSSTQSTTPSTPNTPDTPNTPNTPRTTTAMGTTSTPVRSSITTTTPATSSEAASSSTPLNDEYDEVGSGDGVTPSIIGSSRRPRPITGGGFDLFGFLRNAFDINVRQQRQLMSNCRDRITMPCIIEDFISTEGGMGAIPGCEPIHCGAKFCASGITPCRMESTVTPFYIGVHFGAGENKGSAEDNIGACLRYTQVPCV